MEPQREEFYGRIARLEGMRAEMPAHRRPPRRVGGGNWAAPIAMVLAAVLCMKAVVHANVGPDSYNYRIALLSAGDAADRIGAWVLAPDPVTERLSSLLRAMAD